MKILLLSSFLFLLWVISCNKEKETSGMTIVSGMVCGWCGGTDSLIISENSINYRSMRPCNHHAYSRVSPIDKSEWDKLTGITDLDEFGNIRLNTCNVCSDGCDKWITITNGSFSHTIRFGNEDSAAVQSIKPLVDKLDSLRAVLKTSTEI
jgi:hypothetical protein